MSWELPLGLLGGRLKAVRGAPGGAPPGAGTPICLTPRGREAWVGDANKRLSAGEGLVGLRTPGTR